MCEAREREVSQRIGKHKHPVERLSISLQANSLTMLNHPGPLGSATPHAMISSGAAVTRAEKAILIGQTPPKRWPDR